MLKRRGQVTLFVILSIVLVVAIALFLFFSKGDISLGREPVTIKSGFLELCMEEKLRATIDLMLIHGGYTSNTLYRTFKFDDEPSSIDVSFLCYTQNYYSPCINQEPMLIQHLKDEIKEYVKDDLKFCFNDLVESFENQGYDVGSKYRGFEVKLTPTKVILDVDAEITLTKTGETSRERDFELTFATRLYDLASVAQEIVSQEARFCNFENLGFMLIYNQYSIDQFRTGDSVSIYTVEHKKSKEWFRFAVRSCVIPSAI